MTVFSKLNHSNVTVRRKRKQTFTAVAEKLYEDRSLNDNNSTWSSSSVSPSSVHDDSMYSNNDSTSTASFDDESETEYVPPSHDSVSTYM
jgi:hypothetical protein